LDFASFVLLQVGPAPRRVLEIGCGPEGGVAPVLAGAGHSVVAIDPDAPEGRLYRRVALEHFHDPGPFDAAVGGRVLHHVRPLGPALDKLAALAPLLVIDEFAWNHIDGPTQGWYQRRYVELSRAGRDPQGPASLDDWRAKHSDLHPYEVLRAEIDRRYRERHFEWRPYFYRWLRDPETEALEKRLIAEGAIRPIGFRYAGVAR
jgi:hypothetical protein